MDRARERFEQFLTRHFGHSSTPQHYLSDLKIFIRVIGDKEPDAITPADVDAFIDHQIAAGLSPATINRRLAALHTFFEMLAEDNLERHWPNPIVWRRHRLKTGMSLPRDVPDADVTRLFAAIGDERDRAIFGLMVGAGLRVGEVVALCLNNLEEPTEPDGLAKLRVRGKGDKERTVWLAPSLRETLDTWIRERPQVDSDRLFLNHHGRPISVAGIQYRLRQHCQAAGVTLTCHRLRHTFARRLTESGLPVDSLAKLLGHAQLQTTQRYIDGADPTVRADFDAAIAHLEMTLAQGQGLSSVTSLPLPRVPMGRPRMASQAELMKLRRKMEAAGLPRWLSEALDAYFTWRWSTWRAETAHHNSQILLSAIHRIWTWLQAHRQVGGWDSFHRADLEAWLAARCQSGVSNTTVRNELAQLRMVLRFMEGRDCPLDPGLFRVKAPSQGGEALPRYLDEADYRRLETTVMQATQGDSYNACFDRAWFLTFAHTGMRLSELLDWRLEDLNLRAGCGMVRGSKAGRDRTVYLTPPLIDALRRYLSQRPDLPGEDHVFLLRGKRPPSRRTIQTRLARYGQQAGVHVSPHRLRHTAATRLLNRGMPINSLRKLLGHQDLQMTQIYARVYDETLYNQFKAAMSQLEAIAVEDWPRPQITLPVSGELLEPEISARGNSM